jgi:hypothetical protein
MYHQEADAIMKQSEELDQLMVRVALISGLSRG